MSKFYGRRILAWESSPSCTGKNWWLMFPWDAARCWCIICDVFMLLRPCIKSVTNLGNKLELPECLFCMQFSIFLCFLAILLISDKVVFLRGIQKQQHPPVLFKGGIQFNSLVSYVFVPYFLIFCPVVISKFLQ